MVRNHKFDVVHTTWYWRRVDTCQVFLLFLEDDYGYEVCRVSFNSFS